MKIQLLIPPSKNNCTLFSMWRVTEMMSIIRKIQNELHIGIMKMFNGCIIFCIQNACELATPSSNMQVDH